MVATVLVDSTPDALYAYVPKLLECETAPTPKFVGHKCFSSVVDKCKFC